MKKVVVDFESYYSKKDGISVTTQGNANYFAASDAYLVSIVSDDIEFCGTIEQAREQFPESFWSDPNIQFAAANANFDQGWAEKYGWETAHPWHCILDHAKFHQLPDSLPGVSKVVLGKKVDKTLRDEMDGVDFWTLPEEKQQALVEYCLTDSVEEKKIWDRLPPMSPVEEKIAAYTRMTNNRGVYVNSDLVEEDKTRLHKMRFDAFNTIPWHATDKPLSYTALSKWCGKMGIPVPASTAKNDEECSDLMSDHPALNEVLSTMRAFRKTNTIVKKADSLLARLRPDSTLPLELLYCGARHTRRWSSRGFNIQNLDREPLKVGDTDVWTRRWITPRPGKVFLILDFAQIEPRCLNWLVGNDELINAMRSGFGIYEAHARLTMGWKGGKLKDEDPNLYKLAKARVIGAGYGCGANTFVSVAKAQAQLDISLSEARAAVDGYRKSNPRVTQLWKRFDSIIRQGLLDKEKAIALELPTGDLLHHFHLQTYLKTFPDGRKGSATKSFTIKGDFGHDSIQSNLWGGVLTENFIQRMARDLMVEAILNLEAAGLPVLFSSHDEVIIEVDDDASKTDAEKTALEIMRTPPEWAPGLPLEVEGGFERHYTK